LSHDGTPFKFIDGCTRLGKVVIGRNCYVGENSIILPSVEIGDNVIIAPNSVVSRSFGSNLYIVGRPARVYRKIDDCLKEKKKTINLKKINRTS
jgi:maltose O-acetyltransferase